jgi:hypothetical protein
MPHWVVEADSQNWDLVFTRPYRAEAKEVGREGSSQGSQKTGV